jgi:hypothetical protein
MFSSAARDRTEIRGVTALPDERPRVPFGDHERLLLSDESDESLLGLAECHAVSPRHREIATEMLRTRLADLTLGPHGDGRAAGATGLPNS